jgi:hypothetical protein
MQAAQVVVLVSALGAGAGARADHPVVDFSPGAAGPVWTIPAVTVPEGRLAFGAGLQLARPERLTDDELRDRASRHIHAHGSDYLLSPSLSAAYGIARDVSVGLTLPYVRRAGLREAEHGHAAGGAALNTVAGQGDSSGVGDLTVLGKYRFANDPGGRYQLALLVGMKVPTGETRRTDARGERFATEHQPGSGSWDPLLGGSLTRRMDNVSLDASLLYLFARKGAQNTELGDRASFGIGLSYRLRGADHHDEGHSAPHAHSAWDAILELNGEWEDKQKIAGAVQEDSGGRVLYLSPGVRFVSSSGWAAVLSFGMPVAQHVRLSHPETKYRLAASLGWVL